MLVKIQGAAAAVPSRLSLYALGMRQRRVSATRSHAATVKSRYDKKKSTHYTLNSTFLHRPLMDDWYSLSRALIEA